MAGSRRRACPPVAAGVRGDELTILMKAAISPLDDGARIIELVEAVADVSLYGAFRVESSSPPLHLGRHLGHVWLILRSGDGQRRARLGGAGRRAASLYAVGLARPEP